MTGRYKEYPEYKDSGIEWLGDIPVDWTVSRLKFIVSIFGRIGFRGYTIADIVDEGEGALVLSPSNVYDGKLDLHSKAFLSWDKYYESPEIIVEPNDILLVKTGSTFGKSAIVDDNSEPMTINPQMALLKRSKIPPKYLAYVMSSDLIKSFIDVSNTGSGMPTMTQESINSFPIPMPSSHWAGKIANFLDHETAKIDTLITKQEKLIELLKEKRQAVISHAVTKGLNPDAPMKDSGVEWLGEVPEHWEIKKIKYCASLISSKQKIDGQPVIALENIEGLTGDFIATNSNYNGEDVAFLEGDILFGKLRPYLAKVFLCQKSGIAFGDLLTYRPNSKTESSFLFYTMISSWFIEMVNSSTYGAKMPRASSEFVNEMFVSLPPLEEQEIISKELHLILQHFKDLTDKANRAIKLMNERKTALISATVTGKVDVRDWQVK